MSPQEYAQWRKKEAEIGACWATVIFGLLAIFLIGVARDPVPWSPWTWVIAGATFAVPMAGLVDDIWGRGKKNRAIRAEHAHLRSKPRN